MTSWKRIGFVATLTTLIAVCVRDVSLAGPLEDGKAAENRKDFATALKLWQPLADQGNAGAQYWIGYLHDIGEGVPQDGAEAMKWYRKAADQGMADAQFGVGTLYQFGNGVKQDTAEAARWFSKAAEQGHAQAQNELGAIYVNGGAVKQDDALGMKWIRKSADQGYAPAQLYVGSRYKKGEGATPDYVQAFMWISLSEVTGDKYHRDMAEKQIAELSKKMSPEQIAEAKRLAAAWKPSSAASKGNP